MQSWWANSALLPPPPRYAGLTSAQEVADRQAAADANRDARARRSSLAGLTLRTAWEDLRDVVVGVPADLFGASGPLPLADLLVKNDRMRGLGLLLLLLAFLAVAVL